MSNFYFVNYSQFQFKTALNFLWLILYTWTVSSKTYLMLIISLRHWETRFEYWKNCHQGLKQELNWECYIHCHPSVGQIFLITIIRSVPWRYVIKMDLFVCWCNSNFDEIFWFCWQILPLLQKHKVVHLNKTDARLANNGLPLEIQKLRCRVNFKALKFTSQIEELGRRVVKILREKGPFLVLHLRYEMDMLAFSGCTHGCNIEEVEELTQMR